MTMLSSQLPYILCLHGAGTSASIFSAQMHKVRAALQDRFNFVFIDAPLPSPPGTGVLPCFGDSGPYFCWFDEGIASSGTVEVSRTAGIEATSQYIDVALWHRGLCMEDMTGVLGFSQGAVVASLMLLLQKKQKSIWSNGLRFGILLCGVCEDEVVRLIGGKLDVPSLHVLGLEDPWLEKAKMLARCYREDVATWMEFEGGHHLPSRVNDVQKLAVLIGELSTHGENMFMKKIPYLM